MVQISRLTPAQGVPVGGTSVLIEGSGFTGVTAVYFGSTPALSFNPGSDSSLTAISPPATAGPVMVIVVTAAGTSPSSSPEAIFTYKNLTLQLLRPDDLLALTVECINLTLKTDPQQAPHLERLQADQAAYLIVHFPPQHLAERVFTEFAPGQLNEGSSNPPIFSIAAGASRLAFRVPDSMLSIPLTLQSLLEWTRYQPQVITQFGKPGPQETAIEVPYRMVLSPNSSGNWMHTLLPITHGGDTELWYTSLVQPPGNSIDAIPLPPVRAVWAVDAASPPPTDTPGLSLDSSERMQIARLSSDSSTSDYTPTPLNTHRLMLSALGAWSDVAGSWASNPFAGDSPPVAAWRHITAMGRDQYVRVLKQGCLYPFGHRADLVTVTERKLEMTPNQTPVDILIQRRVIVVTEPVRDYTDQGIVSAYTYGGRELPYTWARLTTQVTPALDGDGDCFVPKVDGVPFRFHLVLDDCEGQSIECSMPLVWGPLNLPDTAFHAVYDQIDKTLQAADLKNQLVALAPSSSDKPGTTHLNAAAMWFHVQQAPNLMPSLLPLMKEAAVNIPAISNFLGATTGAAAAGATIISFYHDVTSLSPGAYLTHGFTEQNAGEVFAYFDAARSLPMPSNRIGGMGALNMAIDGLSRSLGPVAQAKALAQSLTNINQSLDVILNALDFKILGVSLKDIIQRVLPPGIDPFTQIPKLLTTRLPDAVKTSFNWQPTLTPSSSGMLILPKTQLQLHAEMVAPLNGSEPTFTVDGSLSNSGLNFADVLEVNFGQLRFHAERSKKVDLSIEGGGVTFQFINELSFLNVLTSILPTNGFSDPPAINATATGVTAGYTLAIPSASIGMFSLENLALSAQLSLPFSGPCGLTLDFSDRFHPFLVTVSLIGGGGFLGIGVDTTGITRIEGSLELGANLSVDLAIVSANAHIMAGFYFRLEKAPTYRCQLSAYLRIGASVDLLGLISVSIDLYMDLHYVSDETGDYIGGSASLTVSVHVLFATPSFTLRAQKRFDVPKTATARPADAQFLAPPSFSQLSAHSFDEIMDLHDWQTYCQAYA